MSNFLSTREMQRERYIEIHSFILLVKRNSVLHFSASAVNSLKAKGLFIAWAYAESIVHNDWVNQENKYLEVI